MFICMYGYVKFRYDAGVTKGVLVEEYSGVEVFGVFDIGCTLELILTVYNRWMDEEDDTAVRRTRVYINASDNIIYILIPYFTLEHGAALCIYS